MACGPHGSQAHTRPSGEQSSRDLRRKRRRSQVLAGYRARSVGEVAREGGSVNLGPAFTRVQRWGSRALPYWQTESLEAPEGRDRVP